MSLIGSPYLYTLFSFFTGHPEYQGQNTFRNFCCYERGFFKFQYYIITYSHTRKTGPLILNTSIEGHMEPEPPSSHLTIHHLRFTNHDPLPPQHPLPSNLCKGGCETRPYNLPTAYSLHQPGHGQASRLVGTPAFSPTVHIQRPVILNSTCNPAGHRADTEACPYISFTPHPTIFTQSISSSTLPIADCPLPTASQLSGYPANELSSLRTRN